MIKGIQCHLVITVGRPGGLLAHPGCDDSLQTQHQRLMCVGGALSRGGSYITPASITVPQSLCAWLP